MPSMLPAHANSLAGLDVRIRFALLVFRGERAHCLDLFDRNRCRCAGPRHKRNHACTSEHRQAGFVGRYDLNEHIAGKQRGGNQFLSVAPQTPFSTHRQKMRNASEAQL